MTRIKFQPVVGEVDLSILMMAKVGHAAIGAVIEARIASDGQSANGSGVVTAKPKRRRPAKVKPADVSLSPESPSAPVKKKRKISAAARKRMASAQRARWTLIRKQKAAA